MHVATVVENAVFEGLLIFRDRENKYIAYNPSGFPPLATKPPEVFV
jgi:hypothetical protein